MKNRRLEHISAAKIRTNPLNTWGHGELSALKASIKSYGIINPLDVIGPDSEGVYTLLSGERRLILTRQICKEDGISLEDCLIPCHIIGSADMPEDIQSLYIEAANFESRIETPKDVINEHRAGIVKKLLEMCDSGAIPKRKLVGIASKYMQTSDRYARYWTTVFSNGTDELQEMVSKAEVFPQDAAEIAHFDEKTQNEYIKRIKEGTSPKEIVNEIHENRKLFSNLAQDWVRNVTYADVSRINRFCAAFPAGDVPIIQETLQDYLWESISIRDTAVRTNVKENFYHGMLLGLLQSQETWSVQSNMETGIGYSDISIRTPERTGIVIELKYAHDGDLEKACAEALKQIEDKKYAEGLKRRGMKKIIKYGIAFCEKECMVVMA